MYLIRLDDAAENMNKENWLKIEKILNNYSIKPIVGVIPFNEDKELLNYDHIDNFWKLVKKWEDNKWTIAMHGYNHVYSSTSSGINPMHMRSEFAGLDYEKQKKKIIDSFNLFKKHKINPTVFFAPSHTFDMNTLKAIKNNTNIEIISDTISNDIYYKNGLYFIPVQSGKPRKLFFKVCTIYLHPNTMNENDFENLEYFVKNNIKKIGNVNQIKLKKRKRNLYDIILEKIYYIRRRIKK